MTDPDPIDPDDLVTIWQSELAALAVDRECHERLVAAGHAWALAGDPADGRTGPDATPGAAPVDAASGLGSDPDALRLAGLWRATAGL